VVGAGGSWWDPGLWPWASYDEGDPPLFRRRWALCAVACTVVYGAASPRAPSSRYCTAARLPLPASLYGQQMQTTMATRPEAAISSTSSTSSRPLLPPPPNGRDRLTQRGDGPHEMLHAVVAGSGARERGRGEVVARGEEGGRGGMRGREIGLERPC
jgi:hypothetical protein